LVPDDPEKPKPTNDLGFFIGLAGFHAIPSAFATRVRLQERLPERRPSWTASCRPWMACRPRTCARMPI